ncbi:hypothetical protein [Chryseobacterium sp. KCF3-3]|uniref:hypothetical protein n=1 Tax=Chryseobacterium sp. KCF3-3 TaxID=3231511 RepID=UPI0038B26616
MRKIYLLLTTAIICLVKSQTLIDRVQIKSPQTYAFEKYGNVPVNLYTGMLDLKIPIYSLSVNPDNDINIFLSYDSSGFIPHKKSDLAGMNWSLIAGGRITRTMHGVPDEYIGNPCQTNQSNPFGANLAGFLAGVRKSPYTNTQVYDLNSGAGNPTGCSTMGWKLGPNNSLAYEGEPDLFNFTVQNLHGKFMIGNDGNVIVESNDPGLKVDLSQMVVYNLNNSCRPPSTTIKLIDSKGNKYYFGGSFPTYEISYPSNNANMYSEFLTSTPYISSFALSMIEFSDGKNVSFNYMNDTLDDDFCINSNPSLSDHKFLSYESFLQQGSSSVEWITCSVFPSCFTELSSSSTGTGLTPGFILLKKSLLESIVFDNNYKISFNYKDIGYQISYWNTLGSMAPNEYLLDNIQVYSKNNLIQNTLFIYSNFGGTNKRPFLTNLKEFFSNKEYSLEYYDTEDLPTYYTRGIDHWGFWNGKVGNTNLIAFDTYDQTTGNYTLNNTTRDPNAGLCKKTLLKKIIYPTKGYSIFDYEPHYYKQRLERNSSSSFLPVLTNNNGMAGGARIKNQYDFSENGGMTNQKNYQYTTSLNGALSSGILMNWPRYMYYFETSGGGQTQKKMLGSGSNVQQNSLDSYNVGYSKVFEIDTNKGYIEHNYTNYNDYPDIINPDASNLKNWFQASGGNMGSVVPENLYKNFKNLYGTDRSILRGKPKKDLFFKEGGLTPLKKIEYLYTDNIDFNSNTLKDNANYVTIQHMSGFWVQAYKKYFNPSNVKKEITTIYVGNDSLITTKANLFEAPNHLNISSQKTSESDNIINETIYNYAHEKGNQLMISKNMVGIPLETITNKIEGVTNKTLSKTETLYPLSQSEANLKTSGLILPFTVLSTDLQNVVSTEVTYDKYDSKGNIQQYTTKNGLSTVIVWGYNQTQPIAKIEGAKLTDISQSLINSIVTPSNTDASAAANNDETSLLSVFNTFRNSLPNFQITTYTYDPLIGVRSITPPSGIREVYIYDSANRLKEIRENSQTGNLLKEFKYNYKQ